MKQLVQLQNQLENLRKERASVLVIHCECSPEGTKLLAERMKFGFPLANDDRLNVVDKYSVTSTYLIDSQGILRARWLDRVHQRVDGATILKTLRQVKSNEGKSF